LAIFAKIEIMEAAIIVVLVVVFAILVVMMIIALGSRRKDSKTISFESKTTDEPKQLTQQEKSGNYQAQGGFNFAPAKKEEAVLPGQELKTSATAAIPTAAQPASQPTAHIDAPSASAVSEKPHEDPKPVAEAAVVEPDTLTVEAEAKPEDPAVVTKKPEKETEKEDEPVAAVTETAEDSEPDTKPEEPKTEPEEPEDEKPETVENEEQPEAEPVDDEPVEKQSAVAEPEADNTAEAKAETDEAQSAKKPAETGEAQPAKKPAAEDEPEKEEVKEEVAKAPQPEEQPEPSKPGRQKRNKPQKRQKQRGKKQQQQSRAAAQEKPEEAVAADETSEKPQKSDSDTTKDHKEEPAPAPQKQDVIVNDTEFLSAHWLAEGFPARLSALVKDWREQAKEGHRDPLHALGSLSSDYLRELRSATDSTTSTLSAGSMSSADEAPLLTSAHRSLAHALGLAPNENTTHEGAVVETLQGSRPLTLPVIAARGLETSLDLVVLDAVGVDAVDLLLDGKVNKPGSGSLAQPMQLTNAQGRKELVWSVARAVSEILASQASPHYVLVFAGRWVLLTDAARWSEGRYLALDLVTAMERRELTNSGGLARIAGLISAAVLLPDDAGENVLDKLTAESTTHAVGVSEELRVGLRHGVQGHGCDHEHDGRHQGDDALPDGCGSRGPHRCGGLLRGFARFPRSQGWADPGGGRGIVGGDAERFTQTPQHHVADDHHPHRQHGQCLGQQSPDIERGMLKGPPPQETLEENQDHGTHTEERDEPSRRERGDHEPDEEEQATTEDEPLRNPGKEHTQRQRIVPPHHGQDESRHEGDQPAETRHPEDHHPPCQGASDVVECLGHAPHY